jgi:hypothetical protein
VPQLGTLDVEALRTRAPVATALADESWQSEDCRVLNLSYELDDRCALDLLPPALHPTVPLYATLMLRAHPTSPVGPFRLAEVRVMARAGIHPGGYTVGAFADTRAAVDFLRGAYGCPARLGEVAIERRHYATLGSVHCDGTPVLDVALEHAEPIGPGDFMYAVSFHLALVDSDLRLVQAEPVYTPTAAERGTPRVRTFDPAAFGEPRLKLTAPLPGTFMTGTVELRRVRWLIDPKRPAIQGSVRR